MIVCLCKGIPCSAVRRAIQEGACDLETIGEHCGAGTDCGSCMAELEELLFEETSATKSTAFHLPVLSPERAA
jgi:bacterioferritin-associated ferredoxin